MVQKIVRLNHTIAICASLALSALTMTVPTHAMMGGGSSGSSMNQTPGFDASYNQAVAQINKDDLDGAIMTLKTLNTEHPGNADVLNYLGYSHRQKGLLDEARQYYDQALAVDPKHKGATEYLGELFLRLNDLAAAEEQLKKLDSLCSFGCAEYRELKKKIDAYRAS